MNILVLGGTQFIGKAIVEVLLRKGHQVAIFHRGKTGAGLFPECEHILGDRNTDLAKADTREWDAIIDVSCYYPDQARAAAKLRTKYFAFISTISVYNFETERLPMDEESEIVPGVEGNEISAATYGPLKVRCEEVYQEAFKGRLGIVRPGIVFGPYDPTNRFPYWINRVEFYEEFLVPDVLDQIVQGVDVFDLADFTVEVTEKHLDGIWNAVGLRVPFGEILDEIRSQVGKERHMALASVDEIKAKEIQFWADLPLTFEPGTRRAVFNFDPAYAHDAGFCHRPMSETVRATLKWCRETGLPENPKAGLTREREEQILAELKAQA